MNPKVAASRSGDVAVLTIDNPPVNALSAAVRAALADAIEEAVANDAVRAIVLAAAGKNFSAGADIREFDLPAKPPHLVDVVQRIEDAPKPVIAALQGNVLGGGCELALGCHYRVAAPGTRAGHPEVNVGLMAGDGGTQRLPRLIGFDTTLALMLDGKPRAVEAPEMAGFVDEIAGGDLLASAIAFARNIVAADASPRRTRSLPLLAAAPEVFERYAQSARKRRGEPAPAKIVAAVHRATEMPFPEAVARARADLLALRDSPESRGLRHAFFAEREAAKLPSEITAADPREMCRAGVVGAGLMGQGIAIALLDAGLAVTLVETTEAALARARERIEAHYEAAVGKGRVAAEDAAKALARLDGARTIEALADVDCVIEAVFEDIEVKRGVFETLDRVAKPEALLATNTSYLDVA
ncbi:MAG TPA: 3-hydroxyacyl-CoA dehydrogenase NAD-binding domain-containing protein, partial [Caldimonas sp.]|nr:3-hydroxyacyl-CoA dehydrogenase NAD-binding domain-containing protein [Caldimonas sp.]